jgi:hypothetical protein
VARVKAPQLPHFRLSSEVILIALENGSPLSYFRLPSSRLTEKRPGAAICSAEPGTAFEEQRPGPGGIAPSGHVEGADAGIEVRLADQVLVLVFGTHRDAVADGGVEAAGEAALLELEGLRGRCEQGGATAVASGARAAGHGRFGGFHCVIL